MKVKLDTRYVFANGKVIIRPMAKGDISPYTHAICDNVEERKLIRKQLSERLERIEQDEDCTDFVFCVLYDGKFYGTINTIARDVIGTKANVNFLLPTDPQFQDLNVDVVKTFINFCRETKIYDNQLYLMSYENGQQIAHVVNF